MSQAPIFCPFCGAAIQQPDQTSSGTGTKVPTVLKVVGGVVAGTCVAATAAGFAPAGIVAGSFAAMWQASIGNVAGGSLFATAQSIGATGGFISGMAGGGAAFGAGTYWESKNQRSNEKGKGGKKQGKGEKDISSDRSGSEPNEGNVGGISLTCPKCNKTFDISVPNSGPTTTSQ